MWEVGELLGQWEMLQAEAEAMKATPVGLRIRVTLDWQESSERRPISSRFRHSRRPKSYDRTAPMASELHAFGALTAAQTRH